jgi:hypothetical protein
MLRRAMGYAVVFFVACVTILQASSTGALVTTTPNTIYLGTVDGCKVTLVNVQTVIVTNADGTKTAQTVGTCNVSSSSEPCPAEAPWPQTASSCANPDNVSEVCSNNECIQPYDGWGPASGLCDNVPCT